MGKPSGVSVGGQLAMLSASLEDIPSPVPPPTWTELQRENCRLEHSPRKPGLGLISDAGLSLFSLEVAQSAKGFECCTEGLCGLCL